MTDAAPADRRGREAEETHMEEDAAVIEIEDVQGVVTVTKLGRLVREGKMSSFEDIYLFSLAIKEFEIIYYFIRTHLEVEVLKILPVQKQTHADHLTRLVAIVNSKNIVDGALNAARK